MPNTVPAAATGLPHRRQIESTIESLIAILDLMDADADSEPSLGWPTGGFFPENEPQAGLDFAANADAGADIEQDESDYEAEPDLEASLGWTHHENQAAVCWQGASHRGHDLEDEVRGFARHRKCQAPPPAPARGDVSFVGSSRPIIMRGGRAYHLEAVQ